MTEADHYDVVFLALARDCAATIPGVLRALQALGNAGVKVRLLVGENGSRDETRELLEGAASSSGMVDVLDTSFMSVGGNRLERMAKGRQFLADRVKGLSVRAVCVVDIDEPFLENLAPDVLVSRLSRLRPGDGPFAVAASSSPTYYDLLAFEDDGRSFTGLDECIRRRQRNPIAYYSIFRDTVYPEQRRLTSSSDIYCTSAFNGLCIYRKENFVLGTYLPPHGSPWICEHVTFNRSIAAATGHKMVIDGALILSMPPEHGRKSLPGFIWQRARKVPRLVASRLGR